MPNARKGKGREWHLAYPWVLPGVGSKATVDHFRLRWVQACGEGESGAYNEQFPKDKRLTPPPCKFSGKTRKYNRHNTLSPFSDLRCAPYVRQPRCNWCRRDTRRSESSFATRSPCRLLRENS